MKMCRQCYLGANDIFILVNIKYGAILKKDAKFGVFMVK